jgi:hypothetical protein
MNDTYTLKDAMDRLELKTKIAFFRLQKRYPGAFVVVNRGKSQPVCYDKSAIDRFATMRAYYRLEKHRQEKP